METPMQHYAMSPFQTCSTQYRGKHYCHKQIIEKPLLCCSLAGIVCVDFLMRIATNLLKATQDF